MAIQKTDIIFACGVETLAGTIHHGTREETPEVLFLYGGGQNVNRHNITLLEDLATKNISSFVFDYSGQGDSTGSSLDSSLKKRTDEAIHVCDNILAKAPKTVIGYSMGAQIAVNLIREREDIQNIILLAPAAYSDRAHSINFGPEFTKILREPGSWRESHAFETMRKFKGGSLLVIGQEDKVIPGEVIDAYHDARSEHHSHQYIRVQDAAHGGLYSSMVKQFGQEEALSLIIEKVKPTVSKESDPLSEVVRINLQVEYA